VSRAGFVLRVLLSHWRRHRLQLATLLVGLMAATALWSGVQAINAQARASYDRAAQAFGARTAALLPAEGETLPQALFATLRRAGWKVSPVVEGRLRLGGRSVRLVGIEPLSLPRGSAVLPEAAAGDLAAFLSVTGETLVAPETAKELGLRAGAAPRSEAGDTLPPLRPVPELPPELLVTDIGFAQALLHLNGRLSRLLIDPAQGVDPVPLADLAGATLRRTEPGGDNELSRLTASFHLNLTAFGLLSFLVGLFIVNSAVGLAFEQRLPMLRTLRACGVTARGLAALLLGELVLIALVAGLAGVAVGYGIAALLLPDVAASLRGLYGASVPGQLVITPQWWLAGLAMSVAGALAASAQALVKVLRLPLLVSAQPVAWQQAQQRALRVQAALALAAFAAAALALRFGTGLVAGFSVLAGCLLGAALLLPGLLALLLRLGEGAMRGPLGLWAFADSRRQLPGLSLALMALLLALAVNVGVGTMVGSFRDTFLRWLDGRLAAEIYVAARDADQAVEMARYLRGRSDVAAVLRGARGETRLGGETIELLGLDDHATFRRQWPLLEADPDVWDGLREGGRVLVSEQLGRRMALARGDRLTVPTPAGPWTVTVGGIYADYGNARGQIAVNVDQLLQRMPTADHSRFGVRAAPADVPAIIAALRSRFGLNERAVADQATVMAESRRIFERTFSVTAALDSLTLLVAGIALLTSLLTLGQARLPQLAPLWALGLTRIQLAGLELAKTLGLALLTALAALPLGVLVAWCLIEVVNVKAFGWRLPLLVDPWQLARLTVVAVLAAGAAALLPMLQLARLRPATLLKVFADER
jgi:putative ABC transport system permease protein